MEEGVAVEMEAEAAEKKPERNLVFRSLRIQWCHQFLYSEFPKQSLKHNFHRKKCNFGLCTRSTGQ